MAEKLADIFAKALAGDITPGYLREVANKEMTALSEAHTASQDPERGWLATLDLLAGETADAKMLDFTERTQKLGEATDWLAKSLAATQAFASLQKGAGASVLNMAAGDPAPRRKAGYARGAADGAGVLVALRKDDGVGAVAETACDDAGAAAG